MGQRQAVYILPGGVPCKDLENLQARDASSEDPEEQNGRGADGPGLQHTASQGPWSLGVGTQKLPKGVH